MGNKNSANAGVGHSVSTDLHASLDPTKHTDGHSSSSIGNRLLPPANGEDAEEQVVEVPPPMQPISSIPVKPSDLSCPPGIEEVGKMQNITTIMVNSMKLVL